MGIRIIDGGALTTVQDLGRSGYQNIGFSVSGVMDRYAYHLANALLKNTDGEAVLEASIMGPTFTFTSSCLFAITGADMSATQNGVEIPLFAAIHGECGDVIKLGFARKGARAYIAFAGGIDVPIVMGSRSTNLKCKVGGFEGRKLERGDEIAFLSPKTDLPNFYKRYEKIPERYASPVKELTLRVVLGPQDDYFTQEGIHTFLNETYTVTEEYDRMGCRLTGAKIESRAGVDIISDGIAFGSVQIPTGGTPIIMMADRQTTGGYAKIATVIAADISLLAQAMPGTKVKFESVDRKMAEKCAKEERKEWKTFYRKTN